MLRHTLNNTVRSATTMTRFAAATTALPRSALPALRSRVAIGAPSASIALPRATSIRGLASAASRKGEAAKALVSVLEDEINEEIDPEDAAESKKELAEALKASTLKLASINGTEVVFEGKQGGYNVKLQFDGAKLTFDDEDEPEDEEDDERDEEDDDEIPQSQFLPITVELKPVSGSKKLVIKGDIVREPSEEIHLMPETMELDGYSPVVMELPEELLEAVSIFLGEVGLDDSTLQAAVLQANAVEVAAYEKWLKALKEDIASKHE